MLVDPANDKSKKSDYTAIWVIGVGGDDNFYVMDIVRDRLNLAERVDMVFKLHRRWRPAEVRYERFGMQTDIDYLKIEMDRRSYRFRIREVAGTRISKEDRIRRLVPYMRNGRVIFPHEFYYTDSSGNSKDLVRHFIEEELIMFPLGKHDDLIDSLSRLAEPGLVLPKHVPEEDRRLMFNNEDAEFTPLDPVLGY
jgi:predicted phage terminase large subunit-like protein